MYIKECGGDESTELRYKKKSQPGISKPSIEQFCGTQALRVSTSTGWLTSKPSICGTAAESICVLSLLLCHAAAAAKSLQSCPTLCDPHRQQPTRLPRP